VCLADKEQQEVPDREFEEQRELLVAGLGEVKVAVPKKALPLDFSVIVIKCLTDHIMDAISMCTFYIRSHSQFLPRGGGGGQGLY
jgi:hypothetical protein